MNSGPDEAPVRAEEADAEPKEHVPGPSSGELRRPLPDSVRSRVIEYGSDVLGGLRVAELPPVLRRVARFEPRRRARLAGPQIAAQLESDDEFRALVAARVEQVWPELARELRNGTIPPAADPVAVAAAAYLIRPAGWPDIVEQICDELRRRETAKEADEAAATIAELRRRLDEAKNEQREELDRARSELREQRRTIADLRRRIHAERQRAKEAEARAEQEAQDAAERSATLSTQVGALESENRRLRNRLEAVESQVENARRAARTGRSADEARLRVLLDVLLDAAHGLRRELALPTSIDSPADLVTDGQRETAGGLPSQGVPDDDPALIDQLLVLPRVHVLVDGYNVTKTGYGTLPLADQRSRLLASLEGSRAAPRPRLPVSSTAPLSTPHRCSHRRVGCGCSSALRERPPTNSSSGWSGPNLRGARSPWSPRTTRSSPRCAAPGRARCPRPCC